MSSSFSLKGLSRILVRTGGLENLKTSYYDFYDFLISSTSKKHETFDVWFYSILQSYIHWTELCNSSIGTGWYLLLLFLHSLRRILFHRTKRGANDGLMKPHAMYYILHANIVRCCFFLSFRKSRRIPSANLEWFLRLTYETATWKDAGALCILMHDVFAFPRVTLGYWRALHGIRKKIKNKRKAFSVPRAMMIECRSHASLHQSSWHRNPLADTSLTQLLLVLVGVASSTTTCILTTCALLLL